MDIVAGATRERIVRWRGDPDVLGVLLVGSRSRGHADAWSDDDLEVVITDEAAARLGPAECSEVPPEEGSQARKLVYDAQYIGWSALSGKADSAFDLDHWPYERARILYDKDGELSHLVAALGHMPPAFRAARLRHAVIDAWIAPCRAKKCLERGQIASANLLVARGARALARIVFALERRWVPLDHWLEPELRTLRDEQCVTPYIVEALVSGHPTCLESGLTMLDERLASEGIPDPKGRTELFLELIHPSNAEERAIHGLT